MRFALVLLWVFSAACLAQNPSYEACLAKPRVDCLFEQALERLRPDDPGYQARLRAFAIAALGAQRPRYALGAMQRSLAHNRITPLPGPLFAEAAALKAEAEIALGLIADADYSLDEAQAVIASSKGENEAAGNDALLAASTALVRAGRFEQGRGAYAAALARDPQKAYLVLQALGIEHARRDHGAEALKVVGELFEPEGAPPGERAVARERVVAEIAIRRLEKNDRAAAIDLPALRAAPVRLEALQRALAIAEDRKDAPMARDLRAALALEGGRTAQSFAAAQDAAERRLLVHLHARALRLATLPPDKEHFVALLKQARSIDEPEERAKAVCELGYTAWRLKGEDARDLMKEGLKGADNAIGACGFWLRQARNEEPARVVLDERIEQLRLAYKQESGPARLGDGTALLSLALDFAELEQGEIRWSERSRLRP